MKIFSLNMLCVVLLATTLTLTTTTASSVVAAPVDAEVEHPRCPWSAADAGVGVSENVNVFRLSSQGVQASHNNDNNDGRLVNNNKQGRGYRGPRPRFPRRAAAASKPSAFLEASAEVTNKEGSTIKATTATKGKLKGKENFGPLQLASAVRGTR